MTECKDGICPVPWATLEVPEVPADLPKSIATTESYPRIALDPVNHPTHYTDGNIECIEAIEASLTPEEYRGYLKGNIQKYIWRERLKDGTTSIKKAQWYIERLVRLDSPLG